MYGIDHLKIDTNTYSGEITVLADRPQIHVILSSDTFFLDKAYRVMKHSRDSFMTGDKPGKSISFLSKTDNLVDGLSVEENIFLRYRGSLFISRKSRLSYCEKLYSEIGYELPAGVKVEKLTVSQRRFVEFYQLLFEKPGIAVVNEITANLSYKELHYLDRIIEKLIDSGTLIIFLTTRCEEAIRLGDVFHIYVRGDEQGLLCKDEVRRDPSKLYRRFLALGDDDHALDRTHEDEWIHFLSESMHIENYVLRVNSVLEGYCSRIYMALQGIYCRIYCGRDRLSCTASSFSGNEKYSLLSEDALRRIAEEPLLITNGSDIGYPSLFKTDDRPAGLICCSLNQGGEHLVVEVGTGHAVREPDAEQADFLKRMALEISIFIENNALHNELLILRESNHRIKNNLQMFLSYISLQRRSVENKISDKEDLRIVNDSFTDMENRMLAYYRLQNILTQETGPYRSGCFHDLIKEIYKLYEDSFELETHVGDISFPEKEMTALGIIINELMNNTAKHNSPENTGTCGKSALKVLIAASGEDDKIRLTYSDNGSADRDAVESGNGIGIRLIRNTVRNALKGTEEIYVQNGFKITITIPSRKN